MHKNAIHQKILLLALISLFGACQQFKPLRPSEPVADEKETTRQNLVRFGKKQIGTRYVYGGKTPKGFDCSGFTCYVFQKENIVLSSSSKVQATQGRRIPIKAVQAGDLVFFSKNGKGSKVTHVAMVVSNSDDGISVIHSTSSKGVKIDNISKSNYWKPKILFARRVL